jgi:DNA (cytosine-5)-methyltransferase 1
MNYYNEHDPKAAAWLRELIAFGHIPAGIVDERDIQKVKYDELTDYTQCHFFAGIGGWPLALRLAGWPDNLSVWTGSCPCQPFSSAGKQQGEKDERHLWPDFRRLIEAGKPAIAFGEQVASKAGREWLAGIRTDLEALAYEVGAADLCAAGVGAPHIRQRIFWVADATGQRWHRGELDGNETGWGLAANSSTACGLADSDKLHGDRTGHGSSHDGGEQRCAGPIQGQHHLRRMADSAGVSGPQQQHQSRGRLWWGPPTEYSSECAGPCGLENPDDRRCNPGSREKPKVAQREGGNGIIEQRGGSCGVVHSSGAELEGYARDGNNGNKPGRIGSQSSGPTTAPSRPWDSFDILPCTDGKARRVESGTFPLADGIPGRVGLLRGYGNAIVPEAAAQFVMAWQDLYIANAVITDGSERSGETFGG